MRPAGTGVLRFDVDSEITPALADALSRHVAAYPAYEIEMTVDTEGGDWAASVSIFTTLKNHGRRVVARIKRASSGGALIAMAADTRQLDRNGYFFLHWPRGDASRADIDRVAGEYAALMSSRCRVPAKILRRWMASTTTIGAKRALDVGLVDAVPGMTGPKLPVVFL